MKDFDPGHPKWKLCCCHITTAAYSVAFVEFFICSLTAAVLTGLTVNDAVSAKNKPFVIAGAGLAFFWLLVSLVLIAAVKRRVSCLIFPHIVMQGLAFCLMLVVMVLVFITGQVEQNDGLDVLSSEHQRHSVQPGTLSIVMAVMYAAATLAITVFMIYILLKLKTYTKAETEHDKVLEAVRRIAHSADDLVVEE